MDLIPESYNVFSVDLRGFGRSGRTLSSHKRSTWAEDISKVIEKLEIKFSRIKDIDDPDKLLEKLFDLYKYVLVRPDLYVYGGSNENDLSEMIESIDKSFELIWRDIIPELHKIEN